jgi:hypothetical protein
MYVQVHEGRERFFDEGFKSRNSCAEVFIQHIGKHGHAVIAIDSVDELASQYRPHT